MTATTDKIAELERQNEELRRAMQGFVDYHTKPAGVTPDVIKDKARFSAFMDGVEQRGKVIVEQARAVLAGGMAIRPTDDKLWEQTLRDRDLYHEWADKLADAIADYFGVEIGEHSNMNCPWYEALVAIENADRQPTATAAGDLPDVREMVNRFLGWPLPKDFFPDCGISFDGRKDDEWNKNKTWPIGTNLLTADQAKAMFEYCLQANTPATNGAGGQKGDAA